MSDQTLKTVISYDALKLDIIRSAHQRRQMILNMVETLTLVCLILSLELSTAPRWSFMLGSLPYQTIGNEYDADRYDPYTDVQQALVRS